MTTYFKITNNLFYDGNGCYDSTGKCFCGECFYYGTDHVNCAYAGDFSGEKFRFENGKFIKDE